MDYYYDKYNIVKVNKWRQQYSGSPWYSNSTAFTGSAYMEFDENTGIFTLGSENEYYFDSHSKGYANLTNNGKKVTEYTRGSKGSGSGNDTYYSITARYLTSFQTTVDQKGTLLQSNIVADDAAYPENGAYGGYWYVRKDKLTAPTISGSVTPTAVTIEDAVLKAKLNDSNSSNTLKYFILLNDAQIYPSEGYTELAARPITINYTIPNNLLNFGLNSILLQVSDNEGLITSKTYTVQKNVGHRHLFQSEGRIKNYVDPKQQNILITPALTANDSNSPIVASASSVDTNPAYKAFNQSSGYWQSVSRVTYPQWLQIDLGPGKEKQIYKYSTEGVGGTASIKDYELQASNDASSWITLDTNTRSNSGLKEVVLSSPSKKYRYYRLYIKNNNGAIYVAEGEFKLYEYILPSQPWQTIGTIPATKDMFYTDGMVDLSILNRKSDTFYSELDKQDSEELYHFNLNLNSLLGLTQLKISNT